MPPGFGLGPDALLAQLVRMANSSSGDAGMAQRQQPNQGALQPHQFQGHPLQQHLQQQHAQSMPMGSMSLGQGAGLDTAALLLQQLAGQGVMQHAPGVQQLPESLLQDLGNMDMGAVSQSGQADAGALNHILAPPASSTPLSSHDTPVQEPPRPSQSQPPVSPWARASEQPGASLSHIQKEQVFDSAFQKAAQRSEVLQGSLNLPDDEDLLFPMPPAAKSQQARPQPTPSQPAIVAPRRRTPAVVAASKTPAPAPAPQPSPVQPTPQYIPEPEPLEHQPQPAAPRPETKVAPWAGAATVQQSQGKSLADIQREEQQRAAARAAEVAHAPAVTVPITQAPMVTGWSHVAKAGMSSAMPPPQQAASVRQIQMQEEMRLRQQQQQAAAAAARATPPTVPVNPAGATPSGITLADMLPQGRGAKGASAWGSGGNMRSIYDEETPADLEGGADEEGLDEALAAFYLHQQQQQQQQQRNQPRAPAAQQAKSIKELQEEEMMRQRQPVPPATRQQAPRTDSNLVWDDEPASEAPAVEGEGLAARSPAFIDWCKEQMQALTGKTDLTLIEFLLTLASGGEVAEYTQMYLGSSAKVSAFTAEFIRRKYADIKAGGSSSKKAKKKAAQAIATSATPVSEQRGAAPILPPRAAPQQQAAPVRAAAAPAMRQAAPMAHPGIARQGSAPQAALQPVVSAGPPPSAFNAPPMAWPTLAGGPGSAPVAVSAQSSTLPSAGSSPLPTASRPVAAVAEMGGGGKGKKGKKGKGGKGQKVDLSLLGFSTGTDYSALEKPER
uniref:GYF domain-containing protein n=1 Tax=Tetraselmis chuii TaxID=63592 RepID=A0A7S1SLK9_9CHLO